jgi:NAD(P)-dependent dehydrogenase (short-subunit alcohol dehydrogenase family)
MMTKTVLITGAGSGIGRATVVCFQQQGWNVAATLRSPEKAGELQRLDRVSCLHLDVTDRESIQQAIAQAREQFGAIDILVNNAGYSLTGPFEACTPEQIQQQFATNVFGLMEVTRAILPHFRQRRQGTIINIASIGGRMAFPLYSLYHATKWAVEGFSESLQYELRPFNICVKIVEPGPIKTDFYSRSADPATMPVYQSFADRVLPQLTRAGETGSPPEVVARGIYRAATDGRDRLRYPVGGNAGLLLLLRKLLPDAAMRRIVCRSVMR